MPTETKECPVCGEINDTAAEKCSSCGELLERSTQGTMFDQRGQTVMGKQIYIDGISSNISHIGDIIVGNDKSDEQYEIALNWGTKGNSQVWNLPVLKWFWKIREKPPMQGWDLSGRDLSGLNLAYAKLQKTNLSGADLSDTKLEGADLSGANLAGAKYTANTTWPEGFEPEEAGAVLVDGGGNPY